MSKLRRTYLIASTPRCGSHFLGHALQETGHFGVPMEYLSRGNVKNWSERLGIDGPEDLTFDGILQHRTSASGWFGFKAHWGQFAPFVRHGREDVFGEISNVIFIYRRDILAQAISYARAKQTGAWISGAPEQRKAVYSRDAIVRCVKSIRRQNRLWKLYLSKRSNAPVMSVAFEDLIANPTAELGHVSQFLDPASRVMPKAAERTKRQSDSKSEAWRERFMTETGSGKSWLIRPQSFDVRRAEPLEGQRAAR